MTSVTLKNVKIVKFLCNHFNIEDVRKNKHFQHIRILCFTISRKVKLKLKCKNKQTKKTSVQCMEKILWLIKHVKSGLQESVLEISHWMMLHG